MTKSKPTVASLTSEVAELKNSVSQLIALLTESTEATPKAKKPTRKAKKPTKKPNGNKWFLKLKGSKVWTEMKDQGSTAKNRAVFAEHKANGHGLKLQKSNGESRVWND